MMTTVCCVLKRGGTYGPGDVAKLLRGIHRHCSIEVEYRCLTDVWTIPGSTPLMSGWPSWWSKLELFRPGRFDGPVFYCDLDSIVLQDIAPMLTWAASADADLVMLEDRRHPVLRGSGIMYWQDPRKVQWLFTEFAENAKMYMDAFNEMPHLGDQAYLQDAMPAERIATWPEGMTACLNLDDEATCKAAAIAYCSWVPKLPEMSTEDSWRGELVRSAWL